MIRQLNKKSVKLILVIVLITLIFILIYNYTPVCTFGLKKLKDIVAVIKDLALAITPIIALYYTNKSQTIAYGREEAIKRMDNEYNDKILNFKEKKEAFTEFLKSVNTLINAYNIDNFKNYKTNYYILLANISKERGDSIKYSNIRSALNMVDNSLCNDDSYFENEFVNNDDKRQIERILASICETIFYK